MSSILWYILIGLVLGILAKLIFPGRKNLNIIVTIFLGMLGAFLPGQGGVWLNWWTFPIGQDWVWLDNWATFPSLLGIVVPVVIAMVFIGIYAVAKGLKGNK
jgi:uncharacterized membrane protein YeaQ/YmgE (transglycosylase-associated protein family)